MSKKKILLVDDDPVVRRVVEMTLGEAYETLHAADGRLAMEMVRVERPDLVLMDIAMPNLDGLAACASLKADPATRSISVIMLTGFAAGPAQDTALQAGADGFFAKPFSPLALLDTIERCLS
ncbi:MAG: response regulator [Chloroflexota bacterium]